MYLLKYLLVWLVAKSVAAISNQNNSEDSAKALWQLSNIAIQSRQNRPYYQEHYPNNYPVYSEYYKPQKQQYGYPQNNPPDYFSNEIPKPPYQYRPPSYPYYPNRPYDTYPSYFKTPFIQKTQQSVMDALFSIAQNDDLQCVPKLLCEITSGGLVGRQGGLNLPLNVNLESLATLLAGVNSANMSPVLHFGKAALLGFASKGNSRSCQYSYPQCPSDPDKLVQYLNNHNGGFFRFFQGLNFPGQNNLQHYAPQYLNGYRPGYFGKQAFAEKRIQNKPLDFVNSYFDKDAYNKKEHSWLNFPQISYTTPVSYASTGVQKVIFPNDKYEQPSNFFVKTKEKSLRFPSESDNNAPYRHGKFLHFDHIAETNDNFLDIQRPLPNHVPTQNIFPDRTGTGELKLDLKDFDYNSPQHSAYSNLQYDQLLYDSFPNDGSGNKPTILTFPNK